MSAAPPNLLSDTAQPSGMSSSVRGPGEFAASAADAVARPKPRVARPRPCFDDGALTRVFKFPSKSYPKSTYYLTNSEVIIRIKKARKKWKLVVPKKRVVDYRTNRWFAKPRWIELELTFTQASRLGLVPPRKPAADTTSSAPEAAQSVGESQAPNDKHLETILNAAQEIDGASDCRLEVETETEVFDLDEAIESSHADADLVSIDPEHWDECAPSESALKSDPPAASVNTALPGALGQERHEYIAAAVSARRASETPTKISKRSVSVFVAAALTLLVACSTSAWLLLVDARSVSEMAATPACLRPAALEPCARVIVTGSIEPLKNTQVSEQVRQSFPETSAAPETFAVTQEPDDKTPNLPNGTAGHVAGPLANHANDGAQTVAIVPKPLDTKANEQKAEPTSPFVIAANQGNVPQDQLGDHVQCRNVAIAARSKIIQFDYASPQLDQSL
jgi:hypothetical protein